MTTSHCPFVLICCKSFGLERHERAPYTFRFSMSLVITHSLQVDQDQLINKTVRSTTLTISCFRRIGRNSLSQSSQSIVPKY